MMQLVFIVLSGDRRHYLGQDGKYYRYVENAAVFQSLEEARDHCAEGGYIVTITETHT